MTVKFLSKMLNPTLKVIVHKNGEQLQVLRAGDADSNYYGQFEIKDFEMSAMSPACIIEIR